MGGKKKGGQGQQQEDGGGSGAPYHQQGGPGQGGSGQQSRQWQPRGPRGPSPHGGPGQPRGGQWDPRGPRGPPQGGPRRPLQGGPRRPHQGGSGQFGPQGHPGQHQQHSQGPPPGCDRDQPFHHGPRDQGFQRYYEHPPLREFQSDFPALTWGNKFKSAPQEPPAQQAPPTQASSTAPAAEAQPKGKGRGRIFQQTAPPAASAAPATAAPVTEAAQPTPAEAKPGKKKQKGKAQGQKPIPAATPSSSSSEVGDLAKKTEKLTLQLFSLPKRKEKEIKHVGDHVAKKFVMEVNYLPLKIKDPKLRIYHYDVHFNPDKPKYLLRDALEKIREKHFSNRHPAFDGAKNMYVAGKPLNAPIRDTIKVLNVETGREKEFDVTIKLANDNLNLSQIFDYCREGVTSNIPQTEIQATDIALRSGLSSNFTAVGRSFFARSQREAPKLLGGGFELRHGFYQSAVATWKPYLNIDVANKAFPIEQPVLDYMCEEFGCTKQALRTMELDKSRVKQLTDFIIGLKVSYYMPNPNADGKVQKRGYTHTVIGLADNPIQERFKMKDDGPVMSVGEYYQREKKYTIGYIKLPLLKIGTKGSMVPIELCSIVGNQAVVRNLDNSQKAAMVRAAARPTWERKERIDENIRKANYATNPTLREFGIEVQTSFEKVEAVVMKAPSIQYNRNPVNVVQGVWRLERNTFLGAATIPEWAVLNLNPRTTGHKINQLERLIGSVGNSLGMNVPRAQPSQTIRGRLQERDIDEFLMKFGRNGVKLVIVILGDISDIYGQVKRASELRTGVLTQCIKAKTLEKINPMTVTNILLKVNAKLTGTNHCLGNLFVPDLMKSPYKCMLVGADVTHPAPRDEGPSIAAVAASQDQHGFQYKMVYRLQRSREEIIVDLVEVMKEQILHFSGKHNRGPDRIIYLRDGVSEGQFQQVLNAELIAIRRACSMIDPAYKPPITFLVVQKRHHTRFFPYERDGDRKNCNVPAGTLVDKQITHPTEIDFYLVSHQSIQGTARPTKYHLLWDDSDIPQIELEKLTYYLCHMFSRCTRSVSYPAPTYYAHLAAFRARAWWNSCPPNMAHLRQDQESRGKISDNILKNFPMFFT